MESNDRFTEFFNSSRYLVKEVVFHMFVSYVKWSLFRLIKKRERSELLFERYNVRFVKRDVSEIN